MKNAIDGTDLSSEDQDAVVEVVDGASPLVLGAPAHVGITGLLHVLTLAMLAAGIDEEGRDAIIRRGWAEAQAMCAAGAAARGARA